MVYSFFTSLYSFFEEPNFETLPDYACRTRRKFPAGLSDPDPGSLTDGFVKKFLWKMVPEKFPDMSFTGIRGRKLLQNLDRISNRFPKKDSGKKSRQIMAQFFKKPENIFSEKSRVRVRVRVCAHTHVRENPGGTSRIQESMHPCSLTRAIIYSLRTRARKRKRSTCHTSSYPFITPLRKVPLEHDKRNKQARRRMDYPYLRIVIQKREES